MNRKVTVFGAGFVGSTTAQRIAEKQLADVVMVDIIEGMPQGKALDMMESACLEGFDAKITGSNDPAACAGSDLIVVTSGIARKPGMSRDDLLKTNAGIVGSVCDAIKKNAPNATVIVVSNPLDVMTYLAGRETRFRRRTRSSAWRACSIARGSAVSSRWNSACRCATWTRWCSAVTVTTWFRSSATRRSPGIKVEDLIAKDKLDALVTRTRNGGAEIVALLKTGSAYYAPSSSVVEMVALHLE